ncbi:MAG: hypothetical protein GY847_42190, partial [Proteobacteria bacterium]|nr:hypothetical protein [Pseudomonadota bacterium]
AVKSNIFALPSTQAPAAAGQWEFDLGENANKEAEATLEEHSTDALMEVVHRH